MQSRVLQSREHTWVIRYAGRGTPHSHTTSLCQSTPQACHRVWTMVRNCAWHALTDRSVSRVATGTARVPERTSHESSSTQTPCAERKRAARTSAGRKNASAHPPRHHPQASTSKGDGVLESAGRAGRCVGVCALGCRANRLSSSTLTQLRCSTTSPPTSTRGTDSSATSQLSWRGLRGPARSERSQAPSC